jgi:hypothetical protein
MLANRKYVGDLPWNETHMGKYSSWEGGNDGRVERGEGLNRSVSRNDLEDVVVVRDLIPPLIDRDTFARAAAALARSEDHTSPRTGPESYLFTHLLVCSDCGSFLRG